MRARAFPHCQLVTRPSRAPLPRIPARSRQFTENRFVESYDPTVEDCYRKEVGAKGGKAMLEIIDTAGTEQFTSMVELYIRNCSG